MNGRHVLVTGAGGFIGSHLVERLVQDGAKVRALAHYNSRNDWGLLELLPADTLAKVQVVTGDVTDPFAVSKAVKGSATVYHLSSLIGIPYSYEAPQSYVSTNIAGAANVMQACLEHEVERVVHTSTSECYGTARYVPIDEAHPLQPQSPYSASKIGADALVESYHRAFGLPVATIRPFNAFGPRQSARAVIPTVIAQALAGDEIRLGSLTPTRDFTYVTDLVDGFVRVGSTPEAVGQVINVGSGREISIGDLAKLILKLAGSAAPIREAKERRRPEASEVERLLCDNRRAQSVLGWAPRVSLEDGLTRTIEWFKAHRGRYKSDVYNV